MAGRLLHTQMDLTLVLNEMNPQLALSIPNSTKLNAVLDSLSGTDVSALPYYFNAWENDFFDNPLASLFANMAVEFERRDLLTTFSVEAVKGIAEIIDACLAVTNAPLRLSGVMEAIKGTSLIDGFEKRREIRDRICKLADESLPKVADKLVVFVDELDRCRPDFAVRLLEQTKNLFCNKNVIFVFSADSAQLSKAVGWAYGPGFDTTKFLERFFDTSVTLSPVNSIEFTNHGNNYNSDYEFDKLVNELIRSEPLTIRDAYRIKSNLANARLYCLRGPKEEIPQIIAGYTILPILVFINRNNTDLFRCITSGADYDAMYEYGKGFPSFINNIRNTIARLKIRNSSYEEFEATDEDCKAYMHDLCVVIFDMNKTSPEYYDAMKRLGIRHSNLFDSRVYKQLKFPDTCSCE